MATECALHGGRGRGFILTTGAITIAHTLAFLVASSSSCQADESGVPVSKGEDILINRCSGCHLRQTEGGFERISNIRKTPEGWDMTIVRMLLWHGVKTPSEERRKLVKFLADSQGLAPEETAPHRAILERRPNFIEREEDTLLMQMCARCHTYGRSALQRRDEANG